MDPKDALAYFNRAMAKIYLMQRDSACEDLEKAASLGHKTAEEMQKKYCQ